MPFMRCGGDTGGLGEGSRIDGKYTLRRKLSEGGGGVVWLTTDPQGNDIALKTLKWSPLKSKEIATERFKNEFAIFKTLAHPNIARIFDFGYDPKHNVYYFTSELLTAGDLRTYGKAGVAEIEPLLLQALRSLEYLRNSGLLHLDIKPQNFLLRDEDGSTALVLIDFGLATFRPPDKPGGTANYMPPEIVARRLPEYAADMDFPPPDHRSDLYSLGVTFYYILTGVAPFSIINESTGKIDVTNTLKNHIDLVDPPPPSKYRSDIPAYLDTIIMKLMAHHPDDRYAAAAVAAQALRYRSPRELEPENLDSLLSYLPKEGKMIGRSAEIRAAESAIAKVAEETPHAPPILFIVGGRGVGRSRLLNHLKPFAQRLEMDTSLIDARRANSDELANFAIDDSESPKPRVLLIDDIDALLGKDANKSRTTAFLTPLSECIQRARRAQHISAPATPQTFIAFCLNTDRMSLDGAMEVLEIDKKMMRTVELSNFSISEVGEYLASLLGEESSEEAAENLHSITEGNPLFITEQMERMISDGQLFSMAGRPDASTLETIGLDFHHLPPAQSMREVILTRLSKLDPQAQKLAALMACWAQPVDLEALHHTSNERDIETALIALISTDLIHRIAENEGHFAFNNPAAATVIEENLPIDERARLHSRIAGYLERSFSEDQPLIDRHRAHGANRTLKLRALERLAKQAEEHRHPHEATEHLEALLEQIPANAWDLRADVLVRLGRAYEWAYMPKHSHDAFKRLMNLRAPRAKRNIFKVRALEQLALASIRRRELEEARCYISQALKHLGKDRQNLALRIRLMNFMAGIDLRDGRADAAVEQFEKTAEMAEELTAGERKIVTNNELGEALLQSEKVERALDILSSELDEAVESGNMDLACSRHYLLGNVLNSQRIARYDEAMYHYEQALSIARERRLLRLQVRIDNGMGNLKLDTGAFDEAIAHYRRALALSEQIDSKTTSVELMVGLGLVHARRGEVDASIEYFEAALDFAGGPMGTSAGIIRRFLPTIYAHLGDAFYRKRNFDRAISYLEDARALDQEERLSDDVRYSIYGTFAEVFAESGEMDKAREYLPLLEEIVLTFPTAKDHLAQLQKRITSRS
jgi:serine/threonine protein kinase